MVRALSGGRAPAGVVVLLGATLTIFVVVGVLGPSNAVSDTGGFRWLDARPPAAVMVGLTWLGFATGAAGVWCGLRATARGWAPNPRHLLLVGLGVTSILVCLPVAGSTDALNYAQFGRLDALGFDPAVTPPRRLARLEDPVAEHQPGFFRRLPSPYGPLANFVFGRGARIGGTSLPAILLTYKIGAACCFAGTAALLHHVAGPSPSRQRRVHLIWTLNPLMIWATVVAVHIDALASFLVVAGLVAVVRRQRAPLVLAVVAGALLGAAAAVKAPYLLVGIGLLWGLRRDLRAAAGVALGGSAVVIAAYALAGLAAVETLLSRTEDAATIYQWRAVVEASAGIGLDLSLSLFLLVGVILVPLLARYLPTPDDDLAVVRPMLVLALAWLLTTPSWRPWYDALMFPLLALMPATALDGLLLLRSALGGIGTSPGVGPVSRWPIPWLRQTFNPWVVSSALLAVFAVIVSRLVAAPRLRRSRPRVVAGSRRH